MANFRDAKSADFFYELGSSVFVQWQLRLCGINQVVSENGMN